MKLSTQALSHVRKLGVALAVISLGTVILASLALPPALAGLVPAFIAVGVLESVIERDNARG
jgi:hypothetical protein